MHAEILEHEIERLQAALDDEMQAHCVCVEARDNAILEADRLRAILFEANNRWRHDFGVAVEAATETLFKRLSANNTDPWKRKP